MCDVDCFIEDNFYKISKSVLENIVGEVDLIQLQCQTLNKVMDDWKIICLVMGNKCYFQLLSTFMQIELWSHIFIFVYIPVIKIISFAPLYFHSYSTSTYFHLVTPMAKHKLDRYDELFPVAEQKEEFDPNFETLAEKKRTLCFQFGTVLRIL